MLGRDEAGPLVSNARGGARHDFLSAMLGAVRGSVRTWSGSVARYGAQKLPSPLARSNSR
eukprot:326338-Chlamydomonas_euryale.AAC.4